MPASRFLLAGKHVVRRLTRDNVIANPARALLIAYTPEYSWNYEGSLHSRWLDDRLTLNANIFYIEWKDQQTTALFGLNVFDYNTLNAGKAHVYGLEIEAQGRLPTRTIFNARLGWVMKGFTVFIFARSLLDEQYRQNDLVGSGRAILGKPQTARAIGDESATTDADGNPLVLARVFAGNPDGRSRALFETRDSMDDKTAAALCDIRPLYHVEGMPSDAVIVDVTRSEADLALDDAMPLCGPFGYNPAGGSIDFWHTHQCYAWFFHLGTYIWDIDPGSFTIVTQDTKGAWTRIADPS